MGLAKKKRRATQLYNLGGHSVKFNVSLLVILPQTVTELYTSMPASPVLRTFFCAVLNHILHPIGKASDFISGNRVGSIVHDKPVKFRDPSLNRSREIPPEAFGGCIFDRFSTSITANRTQPVTSYPVWL